MQEMLKLSLYIDGRWRAGAAGKALALNVDLEASSADTWIDVRRRRVLVPQGPELRCDPAPELRARYRTHAPHIVR
jgi:hypothetical protein